MCGTQSEHNGEPSGSLITNVRMKECDGRSIANCAWCWRMQTIRTEQTCLCASALAHSRHKCSSGGSGREPEVLLQRGQREMDVNRSPHVPASWEMHTNAIARTDSSEALLETSLICSCLSILRSPSLRRMRWLRRCGSSPTAPRFSSVSQTTWMLWDSRGATVCLSYCARYASRDTLAAVSIAVQQSS